MGNGVALSLCDLRRKLLQVFRAFPILFHAIDEQNEDEECKDQDYDDQEELCLTIVFLSCDVSGFLDDFSDDLCALDVNDFRLFRASVFACSILVLTLIVDLVSWELFLVKLVIFFIIFD